jgi:asparagine synthase (glutamine-hydrolysing)
LSGGIDSTIVTGLLAKHALNDFCSFSIAFQEKEFDESEIFKKTIRKFKIKSEILETENIFNGQLFYETIASIEQPQSVPMDIPFAQLSKLVRSKNRKVVLVGEGSDELFGGYLSFVLNNMRWFFATDIGDAFKDAFMTKCLEYFLGTSEFGKQLEQIYREDNSRVIELFGTYPAWYPYWRLTQESLQNIFRDDLQDSLAAGSLMQETLNNFRAPLAQLSEFDQSVYVELKTRLPNYILARADRNSMANSVELRLPFLDNNVIDTALKTPTVFKMLGVKEKFILKSAFKKVVPRHVRKRRKFGYSSPNSWVWDKPDELTLSLMSKASLDQAGIFNSAEVLKMLEDIKREDFKANAIVYQATLAKLTSVLSVQILHDKYVRR